MTVELNIPDAAWLAGSSASRDLTLDWGEQCARDVEVMAPIIVATELRRFADANQPHDSDSVRSNLGLARAADYLDGARAVCDRLRARADELYPQDGAA